MSHGRLRNSQLLFAAVLICSGIALGLTSIPGPFSIDDANHIAAVAGLRSGQFGLPGTEGLPASRELLAFEPAPQQRPHVEVPVASSIPPMYGFFAWPFSFAGVPGLQWLNILGVLWATWLVYALTMRFAARRETAWLAAALFLLGGYVIEYAQGIWAHGLSLGLCMSAFYAAARAREHDSVRWAAIAGLAAGFAAGVRYQNAALAGLVGLGVVLLGSNRVRCGLAYGVGAGVPLALSSLVNHARLGYWNPISKGSAYLAGAAERRGWSAIPDALTSTWARVVDASAGRPFGGTALSLELGMPKDPDTGAVMVLGVARKAMLQSSPWIALALVAIVLAWFSRSSIPAAQRREIRAASVIFVGMLAVFAYFGYRRTEGWSFNQRYLLELTPLAAVCAAFAVERLDPRRSALVAGAFLGVAVAVAALWGAPAWSNARVLLLMMLPVLLGCGIVALSLAERLDRLQAATLRRVRAAIVVLTMVGLGWALVVHLEEDVSASRDRRASNLAMANAVDRVLPDAPVALFLYYGARDPFPGMWLTRDIVIVDTWPDEGRDASTLVDALFAEGREVFVLATATPQSVLRRFVSNRQSQIIHAGGLVLLRLRNEAAP